MAQLQEATAETSKDLVSGVGPIQNRAQYEKLKQALVDARQAGYTLISPGRREPEEGFFVQPTIVVSPPQEADIVQHENFGTSDTPLMSSFGWLSTSLTKVQLRHS